MSQNKLTQSQLQHEYRADKVQTATESGILALILMLAAAAAIVSLFQPVTQAETAGQISSGVHEVR